MAERVKGSENWHVDDRPPDGKVLCTLCHSIEQRKQRTTPNAMGQQRTRMSAPTAVRLESPMHHQPVFLLRFSLFLTCRGSHRYHSY